MEKKIVENAPFEESEKHKRALPASRKRKKGGKQKEFVRRIIVGVVLGAWGLCIVVGVLRYSKTGDSALLMWLISMGWSNIGCYYLGRQQ